MEHIEYVHIVYIIDIIDDERINFLTKYKKTKTGSVKVKVITTK